MERLRNLQLQFGEYTMDMSQLSLILLTLALLLLLGYVLLRRILPWYYNRESTTDQNRSRVMRVVRFVLVSLFVVAVLRILDIDYTFIDTAIQRSLSEDGPPTYLTIKISTLVKALMAFVVANVLDILVEEFLVQRYYRNSGSGGEEATEADQAVQQRFGAVQPLMYTLALLFVAQDTGLADYYLHVFRDARNEVTGLITVGNILWAIFILQVIRLLLAVMTTFLLRSYYQRSKIDTGSQFAINRLLTYFVYFIGVLLVIQAAGFDLLVVWTGAAALLVGIGIGLQQTFNDLICGVIILFERSVKVGDVVELTGHQVGTVRKIGARTSVVETRDDIIIFVPNSKLIGENVINWSHIRRVARFHVVVGVAYGSDTSLVKKLLLQVADKHASVMKTPAPFVRLLDFGSSSLDFDLLFWSRDFIRIENIKSDLRFAIDQAFRDNNIEVPFPQRDLWIRGNATNTPIIPQPKDQDPTPP